MKVIHYSTITLCIITLLSAAAFTGCQDTPTDRHSAEFEADGLELDVNGATIVTVQTGQVTGKIEVKAGEETDHIKLAFIKEDGTKEVPDSDDIDHKLAWQIADESIAEIRRDDDDEWEFHVVGKKAGTTTITLQLLHVDHPDFTTPAISIEVTE